ARRRTRTPRASSSTMRPASGSTTRSISARGRRISRAFASARSVTGRRFAGFITNPEGGFAPLPAVVARLRHAPPCLPPGEQCAQYIRRLGRGDMGTSLFTRRPIVEDLALRLPATIELTVVAMLVSILVGTPLGVLSALWRNSPLDHALRVVTVSGLAIASFW